MPASRPNFSPYPFAALRRVTRREAAFESALARWCRVRPLVSGQLARLAGGPVQVRVVGVRGGTAPSPSVTALTMLDPNAAVAEVRLEGLSIIVVGSSQPIRALAQHVLGGPDELRAPRPLTPIEQSLWSLAIAAALTDVGLAGEVWPVLGPPLGASIIVELRVESARLGAMTVLALCPPNVAVRVPPAPPMIASPWSVEAEIVVARSILPREAAAALRPSDIVTVDGHFELVLAEGRIGLRAAPQAMEATVTTGYVPADMAVIDEAHVEMTVQLGRTRLSLRDLAELAPGQIIPLGRPLAGPYEVRAGGRLVGHGELVDVEGELGVRIVSLVEE